MSPGGGRRTARGQVQGFADQVFGHGVAHVSAIILLEQRSSHPPPWCVRYVMLPTQTRLGAVGAGWPNRQLGSARTVGSDGVARAHTN